MSWDAAVSESNTTRPDAAPGDAPIPRVNSWAAVERSNWGNINCPSWAPVTRRNASSMSMWPSSTSWIAMRNAAAAVRLPTRVCSIHSTPCWMVNSMSHRVAVVLFELSHDPL